MPEKKFVSVKDVQEMFECGYGKACSIIRSVKAYSNSLPLKGKVLTVEFEEWYNQCIKKRSKTC